MVKTYKYTIETSAAVFPRHLADMLTDKFFQNHLISVTDLQNDQHWQGLKQSATYQVQDEQEIEHMAENTPIEALRAALAQQRKYEAENWPFVDERNKPTGSGESITYHLASLYSWSPGYVLSLEPTARLERLEEIWRSFALAGDIIKRYEDATVALLKEREASNG